MNTKDIGNIAEAKVLTKFLELGYTVSKPFGENSKYDLIIEKDYVFWTIQIKSGRISSTGAIEFNPCSVYRLQGINTKVFPDKINFFTIYVPENNNIYFVPNTPELPRNLVTLSLKAHNSSIKRIADDFLIERFNL